MTEWEKAGYSPQVAQALSQVAGHAALMTGHYPSPDALRSAADRLAGWEAESRMSAELHRRQLGSKQGHPALKPRR